MTAGRRRPPQDTISSDILALGTTKVQAAISYDMNQWKLSQVYFKFNFDVFNFT